MDARMDAWAPARVHEQLASHAERAAATLVGDGIRSSSGDDDDDSHTAHCTPLPLSKVTSDKWPESGLRVA